MERLTTNDTKKVCYDPWELCGMDKYCKKSAHEEGGCAKGCHILKMYIKLAEYEDAEEQGKLLLLPCKEGTRAFEIVCDCDLPGDCYTKRMCKGCEYRRLYIEPIILVTKIDILWKQKEFGKTVFFTKAEAEKALAEMEREE